VNKGGRTSTTWETGSNWNYGKTKTVRIPEALESQVMAYARVIDANKGVSHGNTADVILSAIAKYIEFKKSSRHHNQNNQGRELDLNTRAWDELRKFQKLVEEQPHLLGLNE
jgi:hypothetical protein